MSRLEVGCPAGVEIGSLEARPLGCRCRIEGSTILEPAGTPSLVNFCYGAYTACPTWRADKEAVWAGDHDAITASNRQARREAPDYRRARAEAVRRRIQAWEEGDDETAIRKVGSQPWRR